MRTTVTICLAALTLQAGCARTEESRPEAGPAIAATIGHAEMADLAATHEAGGVVRARSTALVASRILAPVSAVHVGPGDRVSTGDRLITLDAREHQAQHARAMASRVAAVSAATAAQAEIDAAEATAELARVTHQRIEALAASRSATRDELDRAVAGLRSAEAALAAARARSAGAVASREAADAAADAAAINLSYAVITAPFDGVVASRQVDPGSMAAPGVPLMTIEGTGDFRLEVELDQARAARVGVGQEVAVRVDAAFADWRPARVVEIARLDADSHTFVLKIGLPRDVAIRSGMFGRARLAGASRRTLVVPSSAIIKRGQLTSVFVAADDVVRLRAVTVGQEEGGRVEVLAGLGDGDRVVLGPADSLRDGSRISSSSSSPSPAGGQ